MANQSLTTILGTNAAQTANQITISKSDLAAVGLSASASNDGESILIAIILMAKQYLTAANQATTPAIQVTLADGVQPTYVTRSGTLYRRDNITVSMDVPTTSPGIDPDNY